VGLSRCAPHCGARALLGVAARLAVCDQTLIGAFGGQGKLSFALTSLRCAQLAATPPGLAGQQLDAP
jgi:hypothetical protein